MWTELPTVESCVPCVAPYSFFFDLVATHWRTSESNRRTLHRICTLARKQGAQFVASESAFSREDVRNELDLLDEFMGGGGAAEAVAFSFFATDANPKDDIQAIEESSLLGTLVLINYRAPAETDFTHSYIYEAVLRPPTYRSDNGRRNPLLNNFISADGEVRRSVLKREFLLRGIYYAQQNSETHVCAHACLRMALNSIAVQGEPLASDAINRVLKIVPPFAGLELEQIRSFIDQTGAVRASIVQCDDDLTYANFLTILAAIVESGHVALLVFTTGDPEVQHVVTVFGFTRNSDEWHPEALPAYSGPLSSRYHPAAFWIDHFLIHDDNFGPYFAFNSRALEFDEKIRARWIIALHPICPPTRPDAVEGLAATLLSNVLPSLASVGNGRWFEMMTQGQLQYVLRTVLIQRDRYLQHLRGSICHAGTKLTAAEISEFADLGVGSKSTDTSWSSGASFVCI